MTNILITGGGGFIGQKLSQALCRAGSIAGNPISGLTLVDIVAPKIPQSEFAVAALTADISHPATCPALFETPFDVIFHLAAVVSGAAEADFDLGMRVNIFGTLNLLEAARAAGNAPIVIYASSVAVHGGEEPRIVPDGVELNPQTSYGCQKAVGELLLNDMSRKGYIDGRGLRLPTVSIRPGRANAAASSFMSGIFREPLQGEKSNCPVGPDFAIWHTAPRTIIANLMHAATVPAAQFGYNRCLNLPGRTDTVAEMIAAMTQVVGPEPERLITWERDPVIEPIVNGWRNHFRPEKAIRLGFQADRSFADSVRWFMEDDHRDKPA
ncbi:D-erythronate dehydrogenase [Algicella marina]|uniref:NAD-dependent epimerase/dehydratase family protein n=1 Tax=Algicella marina TaxID=2683284 RepID=A0A6P1SYI9_9RHOB|nr:D-erythronate dehydrogenase [Algicella marina]QHQ35538.1 NAD-dependent epimerase/dehydratase family protein [Algicella marina]